MRVSFNWFTAVALGLVLSLSSTAQAQLRGRGCQTCQPRCQSCQPGSSVSPDGSGMAPSEMNPELANAMEAPEQSNMDFGASSGPSSSTPGMLGDSYITGTAVSYTLGGNSFTSIIPYGGRYKCADNTGPVPTNRVSFAYKHFANPLQSQQFDGVTETQTNGDIDSYTLGIEKTFLQGDASLEIRVPFYAGSVFNNNAAGTQGSFMESPTFGNLSFIFKTLLSRTDTMAFGAGLGIDVPTAEDTTGRALDLQDITYSQGETYIAPFISFLAVPNDDWWMQGVVQFSFVAGQNKFFSPAAASGSGSAGDITAYFQNQNMVFVTLNAGKWIYKNPSSGFMPGIAAISEINWSTNLENTNVTSVNDPGGLNVTIANFANAQNVINLTLGMHFQLSPISNLRVSAVAPLTSGSDDNVDRNRYFDGEVSVQYNRYF